jgi:hypothetical protein
VLNPSAHLDGVTIGLAEPTPIGALGDVSLIVGAGPLTRYAAVEDPWWGYVRATSRPAPWIQVGGSRGVLAGGYFPGGVVAFDAKPYGPDARSMSAGDVAKMILGKNTGFDDQVLALDVRASWSRLDVPLVTYLELGWEDGARSWGDPGLVAGVLWALSGPTPIALRYEYVAFGAGARWCRWCDTLPAYWYQHVRFQSGWQSGSELLGHPLGGYGHQHMVITSLWTPDGDLRLEARLSALVRERWNLLDEDQLGEGKRLEVTGAWRARGWLELAGELLAERGEGWRRSHWAISAAGFF